MDKFWENYIKTRPADSKGAFEAFRKMSQGPRTMDLAEGGRIGFGDGGLQRQPFAPKNKIRLAGTTIPGKYEVQAASSKWLPNYTYADLLKDLEKGLTKLEIAKNIYQNNKQLYDSIPIKEKSFLKQYKNLEDAKVAKIANSIKNRLQKNTSLNKLHTKNTANLKKLESSVVKDVDAWIKKNASKYKGKQGAYKLFENDLFKFLEKDYSRLIKTAKGIDDSTIAGDKFISKFAKLSDYATSTDEGSNYRAVKKKLYNALDIDWGRDMTGQTTKKFTSTDKAVKKLLPIAQEKGIIDKTYMGGKAKNKVVKITPQNYFEYLKQTQTDPMKKIFGNLLNFSVEHPGGLARAAQLLDSESLGKIISLERGEFGENIKGKPMSANFAKGQKYDIHLSRLIKKAEFEATNLSQAKNFLKQANIISKKASNEFGTLQSTYTAIKGKDGKIQIKVKHPNISLNDSLVSKTKNSIHSFIANNGMKRPVFKKLPVKLQEAITLISNGKNADKVISSHLDDVIPDWNNTKGTVLRNFAGVVDLDILPPGVAKAVTKATSALGKTLKVLGPATLPLDVIPFAQARDLGIDDWGKVGGKNLAQEYLNLPRTIEDLFYVAGEGTWKDFGSKKEEDRLFKYKPRTFGTKATVKALRETSAEDLIANIKAQGEAAQSTDVAYGQQLLDPLVSEEEINKRIEKALKQKEWADSLSPDHELVKEEKKEKTIDPFASIFDPIPKMEFAGGGMAGIRRPSAIPPESGPQSQGLAYLKKYGSYY